LSEDVRDAVRNAKEREDAANREGFYQRKVDSARRRLAAARKESANLNGSLKRSDSRLADAAAAKRRATKRQRTIQQWLKQKPNDRVRRTEARLATDQAKAARRKYKRAKAQADEARNAARNAIVAVQRAVAAKEQAMRSKADFLRRTSELLRAQAQADKDNKRRLQVRLANLKMLIRKAEAKRKQAEQAKKKAFARLKRKPTAADRAKASNFRGGRGCRKARGATQTGCQEASEEKECSSKALKTGAK
jgi:chromosome segregation ATPase